MYDYCILKYNLYLNIFSSNIIKIKVMYALIYQINILLYCLLIYPNILFPI